jgi:hypothetical protein
MMPGDKLHTKNTEIYIFSQISPNDVLYNVLKVNIQHTQNFQKNYQTQRHYTFKNLQYCFANLLAGWTYYFWNHLYLSLRSKMSLRPHAQILNKLNKFYCISMCYSTKSIYIN